MSLIKRFQSTYAGYAFYKHKMFASELVAGLFFQLPASRSLAAGGSAARIPVRLRSTPTRTPLRNLPEEHVSHFRY